MKKINKGFFISGLIFLIISICSFIIDKDIVSCVSGLFFAILSILFSLFFKFKIDNDIQNNLLRITGEIKEFGNILPLKILSNLQILWILILFLNLFKSIIIKYFNFLPNSLFMVMNSFAFGMFLFSCFYKIFKGNFKSLKTDFLEYSIYCLCSVVSSYFLNQHFIDINSMMLYIVFYFLYEVVHISIYKTNK